CFSFMRTATSAFYTLSLHDALPILVGGLVSFMLWAAIRYSFLGILFFLITFCNDATQSKGAWVGYAASFIAFLMLVLFFFSQFRSEEHTSELQSQSNLVCRLLLEKK